MPIPTSAFRTTGRDGFQMTFANGWTVSIQWGYGNYSSGKTAEVARWSSDANSPTEDVRGWQPPERVAEYIAATAAL
jgi:hypothetical protein